jgi:hypothetical protein
VKGARGIDMKEMNWLILLISALATYRLSLMLSSEEGPLAIFARMRRKVPPKTNPGRGIRCFMCWSVWVVAAVTLYLLWLGTITKEILPLYWYSGSKLGSSLSERLNASINSSGRGILPIGSVGIVMGPE